MMKMAIPADALASSPYLIILARRLVSPFALRLAVNLVMPWFMPRSVNVKRRVGTTSTRVYCPYSSGPRNLPISIELIARITVERAVPEIRKKPLRAESSATLTSSSAISLFHYKHSIYSHCCKGNL